MKYINIISMLIGCALTLCACQMNVNPDSIDADLMSEKAVIDRQSVRYVVMTSAQENPNVIIPKLEKVWKSSSDKSGLVANDDVVRVAIAHQLMAHHSRYFKESFAFVVASAGSADDDVATSAISALSLAEGSESLALLFKYAKDERHSRVLVALEAIEARRMTAKYTTSLAGEVSYINGEADKLCKDAGTHPWYVAFCQRGKSGS